MKAIKYIIILTASIFVFNSCTKQVAGPTGPQGAQGPQGASSSYNVTIDSINPATPNVWTSIGTNEFGATVDNIKALSSPNLSIVEVYCATSYNQLATWQELGTANVFSAGDALNFSYTVNQVELEYFFATAPTQMLYVKIVVINQL